jgi:hypothetical protein
MVQMVGTSRKELFKTEEFGLMADEVAQGALSHGLAWFKSHPIQPVGSYMDPIEYPYPDAVFFPREDPDSPTCCTKNEGVGLVGEYQISAQRNLWARYEMRRQGDPALGYDRLAAHDITNLRYPGHSLGEGLGWDVRARGMVYKRLDPAREPDETPNKVMGRSAFQVELRRMTLDLPEESALIVNSFADVTLPAAGVTIDGNGAYGITAPRRGAAGGELSRGRQRSARLFHDGVQLVH